MKKPKQSRKSRLLAYEQVDNWNEQNPVGTSVIQTDDFGDEHERETRSEAWVLPSGDAVIQLTGISGCYLLERVRPA